MDRIEEFRELAGVSSQSAETHGRERFYNTLNSRIADAGTQATRATTYRSVLGAEEGLEKLQQEIITLLESLRVEGSGDQQAHFSGIKQILTQRLTGVGKALQDKKRSMSVAESEVAPERPAFFKNVRADRVTEQENLRITRNTEYELTRQRLQKIESVQRAITENLLLQDERIDSICDMTGQTTEIYKELEGEDDFEGGSFLRRAFFIILLCLSFVILFLNWFHR